MSRFFLVCFDVHDGRRLQRAARELENFGTRVQKSLFECHLDDRQLASLQTRLAGIIAQDQDSVRYYPLCPKDVERILIDGPGAVTLDPDFVIA